MRQRLLIVLVALLVVPAANAGNLPSPLFDQVASSATGIPTSVWCETSWDAWVSVGLGQANGVVIIGSPVIYLSPRQCETLWALQSREDVGSYYVASALLTLMHEAMHVKGVLNEGEADCLALPLVPTAATAFGVPNTVTVERIKRGTKTVVRTVRGKRVRVTVPTATVVAETIPNPYLAAIAADAMRWHRAKPAEYQGNC